MRRKWEFKTLMDWHGSLYRLLLRLMERDGWKGEKGMNAETDY